MHKTFPFTVQVLFYRNDWKWLLHGWDPHNVNKDADSETFLTMHMLIEFIWSTGKYEHLETCIMLLLIITKNGNWDRALYTQSRNSHLYCKLHQRSCNLNSASLVWNFCPSGIDGKIPIDFPLTSVGPECQTQPESWETKEFWGTHSKSWYCWPMTDGR